MTNDLNAYTVDEVVNEVADVAEKCCSKAKKVIISTIVKRDDDIILSTKAEAINTNMLRC